MSKIEEMIRDLCPEGVRWMKLGECCEILDSQRKPVSKGAREKGEYPYYGANGIQDYVSGYLFDGKYLLVGEDGSVINKDNSPILNWAEGKIWVNNHAHILAEKREIALLRYLYFALQCTDVSEIVHGTPPKLNQGNLREIEIPLPPLPIQEKIVEILEKFSLLSAELEAELEGRRKQYDFYRNRLLSFDSGSDSVQWKTLGEVCTKISTGKLNANAKDDNGIYPFFTCDAEPYRINSYAFDTEAILISGNGSRVGHVNYYKGKFNAYQRTYVLSDFSAEINVFYILQYFKTYIRDYIVQMSKKGSIPYITLPMLLEYPIPIPPLAEQERIVKILDKFEALVTDLSTGLPAEIGRVQKQYEYYRNKLLTF